MEVHLLSVLPQRAAMAHTSGHSTDFCTVSSSSSEWSERSYLLHVYVCRTWSSVLIREASLIQGSPLREVLLYVVHVAGISYLISILPLYAVTHGLWLLSQVPSRGWRFTETHTCSVPVRMAQFASGNVARGTACTLWWATG